MFSFTWWAELIRKCEETPGRKKITIPILHKALLIKDNILKTPISKIFPLNVWGLSILLGSLFFSFILISKLVIKDPGELLPALLALMLFAGVFSWPTFLICYFLIRYLAEKGKSIRYIRVGVYIIALTGILLTAIFFDPNIFEENVLLSGLTCYIAGLTISFFTLKINSAN